MGMVVRETYFFRDINSLSYNSTLYNFNIFACCVVTLFKKICLSTILNITDILDVQLSSCCYTSVGPIKSSCVEIHSVVSDGKQWTNGKYFPIVRSFHELRAKNKEITREDKLQNKHWIKAYKKQRSWQGAFYSFYGRIYTCKTPKIMLRRASRHGN